MVGKTCWTAGVRLRADGVMNTSSGPPTENNNHNKDYNNDDNKKPEMSPATAAYLMNIPRRPECNKDAFRHVFLLDFILSPASHRGRLFCTAGDVRNELQRPITHLTVE